MDSNKKIKVHFITLGCKVNTYETEGMRELIEKASMISTDKLEEADICVVNTCSVTNIADRKSRQMIHKAKKDNPCLKVIATGCYVQTSNEEELLANGIDYILNNSEKHKVVEAIRMLGEENGNKTDIFEEKEYEEIAFTSACENTRAFIKIQDGCNRFCSYCIIPFARGRVRSRSFENIVNEVNLLAKNGIKEVVLTGILLSAYEISGLSNDMSLLKVVKAISLIDGIERIRFGSLEPNIISESFIKELSGIKEFCPQFHLSLQSGSNTVLERMNRRYSAEDYLKGVEIIRSFYERPAITTDIIVGFPGETEEEFKETLEFVEKTGFEKVHVFPFSRRRFTKADKMPNQVNSEIKASRVKALMELEDRVGKIYKKSFINDTVEVLLEEKIQMEDRIFYVGHTERFVKVFVDFSDNMCENKLVKATVIDIFNDGVLAKVI
ncbi:MAG: tRNA (N(6)-L-threonylcarbamoyladenosine(37)-C(2))-methylthiotransferase MtaB [Lachnospiraceae bacterium]|nr:tRNA (N(6)-L-threonylcarbamoyladenosine(37)-C(2))-methylthiotransferase MtaB [Lachnospiraceae bacterium]